ncbi:SAICAR synthase [Lipomyces japonicus]|uniref:SAICAR synthase n=1 Tax=Lipomyces japonicus TaxID=56871 RepID=UPI0034CF727C
MSRSHSTSQHSLLKTKLLNTSSRSVNIAENEAPSTPISPTSKNKSPVIGSNASGFRSSFSIARQRTFGADGHLSDVQTDEPTETDEVRRTRQEVLATRELKRRRREFLEDDKVLVGTKVGEDHVNYILAYNMLTGIRVAVSRTTAKLDRELTDLDFKSKYKLAFDISGNELTPSAKYDFKFKDYAPWVFRHLRQLFKLDPADYLISLTSKYIVSELGSPGKSGSFFYFSRDYRFIIKTIHHSEHKFLLKILKEYYNHVKNNPNTLISQFYGLHRVKLPYGRKIHFIIMNNLFPPHRDIHQTFDLKGSTIGRDYDEKKLETNRHATMKDLNWIRRNKHISLGPHKRDQFLKQLEIDVALLKRLHIMDYSLLIGIHDIHTGNTERIRDSTLTMFSPDTNLLERTPSKMERDRRASVRRAFSTTNSAYLEQVADILSSDEYSGRKEFLFYVDDGGFRATNEFNAPLNEIYYLGVIDCLTHYSFVKKLETFWKGLSHTRERLSAIPPAEYGDRFLKFIVSNVKTTQQLEKNKKPAKRSGSAFGPVHHSVSANEQDRLIVEEPREDEDVAEVGESSTARAS